ncbi:MAG TPA: nucleotidyltransferase family protein [Myxococcales bacterium]|nr:nucleotidyltransferase family protein [Myxococcales bacterium]
MRAMILAAGLGTRMQPLSLLRAKPALPVLGRPVIAWLLELLAHHGVKETAINLHHLPRSIEDAVARSAPKDLAIRYSREAHPLGTGGGIARQRDFLAQSDPALVLAGDMLLDCDLTALIAEHRASGADCTLVLQARSPANRHFGTLGLNSRGRVRRIADRFDLGGEVESGVFVGLRIFSPRLFEQLPDLAPGSAFEDLSDWMAPLLSAGKTDIRGRLLGPDKLMWQPVGTPGEYLAANLMPPRVSFLGDARRVAPGTQILGESADLVLGAGARLGAGAKLRRCVVWEKEEVPENFQADRGVFGDGNFYACPENPTLADPPATNSGRKNSHE